MKTGRARRPGSLPSRAATPWLTAQRRGPRARRRVGAGPREVGGRAVSRVGLRRAGPPASEQALAAAERKLRFALPGGLRAFLAEHDGAELEDMTSSARWATFLAARTPSTR